MKPLVTPITFGKYILGNNWEANVAYFYKHADLCLFLGTATSPDKKTSLVVYWNESGAVRFPPGLWSYRGAFEAWLYQPHHGRILEPFEYTNSVYVHLNQSPSYFDIIGVPDSKPVFLHWDKVPWASCIYKDITGCWRAVNVDVSWNAATKDWNWLTRSTYPASCQLMSEHCPVYDGPSEHSLIIRPNL